MEQRKTIIHVIDSLGVGGAERLLKNSLELLTGYRNIVCYLTPPNDLSESLNVDRVYFLDFRTNIDIFKCGLKLRRIVEKENASFIHAHLLKSTWVSRIAAWNKVPLVFTVHNFLSEDAFKVNRLSLYLEKLTYQKGQTLVAVSKAALNDYQQWIGLKDNSFVLYNVISKDFFSTNPQVERVDEKPVRLVAVGNLRRQKNYTNLVRAFQYLKDENVSLDIYGKGELFDELKDIIEKNRLSVRLMGSANNIPAILKKYDAFILASSFEGYGIAPVEAMASGLPVLLSDIEVFHEISCGKALFFNPESAESIAKTVKEFLQMKIEERQTLGDQLKIFATQIASEEKFKERLKDIYQSTN